MSRLLLDPWFPTPALRTVRHQVNNLLAPISVAAEILYDGSDVSDMLQRSADRIRKVSSRMALLTRPGEPEVVPVPLDTFDIAATPGAALSVGLDLSRFQTRVLGELVANGAEVSFSLTTADLGGGGAVACFQVTSRLPETDITDSERANIPVPLTMRNGGLGLAIAALETHLHGGRVALPAERSSLEFLFPLQP